MQLPSHLLERAVDEIAQLPGIGRRTALRLVLHLLKQPEEQSLRLASALSELRTKIGFCTSCHLISDTEICSICADTKRNREELCIVEDIQDVLAIEKTAQYRGLYHVLGGKISPIDGIGPQDLFLDSLFEKLKSGGVKEVIFALSPTIEGDTTNFYIYRKIKELPIKTSTIARGIAVGDELEYADEITLGRSIVQRVPYDNSI
ncbi:MAG: recombination mediator RecR [Flavobacteriaceae bacterium]|nr:recombination mediator RecR [Flavobacteriaceae bacterium]